MMRLKPQELRYLHAYIHAGTYKQAAVALGVSEQAVKTRLYRTRERVGISSTPMLIHVYHAALKRTAHSDPHRLHLDAESRP